MLTDDERLKIADEARRNRKGLKPTEEHLKLLRAVWWDWIDGDAEFQIVSMDPKRPFGDSDMVNNMAELLPDSTEDERLKFYHELPAVLRYVMMTYSLSADLRMPFEPGDRVAILNPEREALRYGKVVVTPKHAVELESPGEYRIYVVWDGNPEHRTYSFDPTDAHNVVNLERWNGPRI